MLMEANWVPVKEVGEIPSGHVALEHLRFANVLEVVGAEQLHAHHGEDEDDDAEDKSLGKTFCLDDIFRF